MFPFLRDIRELIQSSSLQMWSLIRKNGIFMCFTTSLNHLDCRRGLETWEVSYLLNWKDPFKYLVFWCSAGDVNLLCKPTLPCMPHIRQEGTDTEGLCQVNIPSFSMAQQLCMGKAFPWSCNHQQFKNTSLPCLQNIMETCFREPCTSYHETQSHSHSSVRCSKLCWTLTLSTKGTRPDLFSPE